MLLRIQSLQAELLAFRKSRQLVLQRLIFFVLNVLRLLIDLQKAFELQHRTRHAEAVGVAAAFGVDIDRGLIEDGGIHLRGHEALPDQLINLELIILQILLDRRRDCGSQPWDESLRAPPARPF